MGYIRNVTGKTSPAAAAALALMEEKKQKKIKASGTPAKFAGYTGESPSAFRLYDTMGPKALPQLYDTMGPKSFFQAIVQYNQPKKFFSCDCTIQ